MPPLHILNVPTAKMKEWGYSKGYVYDHDTEDVFSGQNYFPDSIDEKKFFHPAERGFERKLRKRIHYFEKLRKEKKEKSTLDKKST